MAEYVNPSAPVLYGNRPRRSPLAEQMGELGGPQVQPFNQPPVAPEGLSYTPTTQQGTPVYRPPAQPQSGYAALTPINPAQDYRSQSITPGYDPRLATAGRQADTSAGALANWRGYTPFQGIPSNDSSVSNAQRLLTGAEGAIGGTSRYEGAFDPRNVSGSVGYGGDTQGVRSALARQLGSLQGPDRSALATQAYDLLTERSKPAYEQELRGVGQKAAALGRIGAGMTTNDLGGVQQRREEQLAQQRRDLSLQAAGQTLNDRLGIAGALQGGFGALSGEDRAAAGLGLEAAGLRGSLASQGANLGLERGRALSGLSEQVYGQGRGLREEDRGERDARFGLENANLNARRGIFGDLSGRESQIFGQNQGLREELRGERGYQTEQAQQGIENAVQQRMLEESLLGSEFGRSMDTADLYGKLGYGYAGDPTQALGEAAGNYQGQADTAFGGIGDLLSQYLASNPNALRRTPTSIAGRPIDDIIAARPQVKNTTRYG